jgi:hypothetical protein
VVVGKLRVEDRTSSTLDGFIFIRFPAWRNKELTMPLGEPYECKNSKQNVEDVMREGEALNTFLKK